MVYLLAAFKCVRLSVGTQESLIKFLRRAQMFDDKYLKMMRHLKIVPSFTIIIVLWCSSFSPIIYNGLCMSMTQQQAIKISNNLTTANMGTGDDEKASYTNHFRP